MPSVTVKFEIDYSTMRTTYQPQAISTTIPFDFGESIQRKLKAAFEKNLDLLYGNGPTLPFGSDVPSHLDGAVEEQPFVTFLGENETVKDTSAVDSLLGRHVDPELIRLRRDLDTLRAIVEDRLQEQPSIRERIDILEAQRRMYLHPGFVKIEEEE